MLKGPNSTVGTTRSRIASLLSEGLRPSEIAERLGVSKSTVSYHSRRLERPTDQRCARRYDWTEIRRYYEAGHSVRECQAHFGFAKQSWAKAVKRGDVVPRQRGMPIVRLLVADTPRGRWNLKLRLLAAGLKENVCEECGVSDWAGRPLSLELHHRNGDKNDNRLEKFVLLCPNCHSQTETFAGRNRRRAA